jgi:hypothetical protein
MFQTNQNPKIMVVDLAAGVKVQTAIASTNQAGSKVWFCRIPSQPSLGRRQISGLKNRTGIARITPGRQAGSAIF